MSRAYFYLPVIRGGGYCNCDRDCYFDRDCDRDRDCDCDRDYGFTLRNFIAGILLPTRV